MAGMEFLGQAPFHHIYIHGLIRDKQGRKMSKSLGNGIDPLEIVKEFGADALKFTLAFQAAQGQDILVDKESFKFGSKFANKIWNATRYLLLNLEDRELIPFESIPLEDIDKWILHRQNITAAVVKTAMEKYRFNDATQAVYEFFWNDFCDWYIEASKLRLGSDQDLLKNRTVSLLLYTLEQSLRLLHPFISFLTEEIYQKLPYRDGLLINQPFPEPSAEREYPAIDAAFTVLQEIVRGIRTLRSEFTIPPAVKIKVHMKIEQQSKAVAFLAEQRGLIAFLTGASEILVGHDAAHSEGSIPVVGDDFEAYVFIKDVIDIPKEIDKLEKELRSVEKLKQSTEAKLSNRRFLDNAPEDVIEKERGKKKEFTRRLEKIDGYLNDLKSNGPHAKE